MKRLLLILMGIITINTASMAQNGESKFPYEKMLHMTHKELINAQFKYDGKMNRYVLNKRDGLNATFSTVPNVNDYRVVIQNSTDGPAYITVTFYDNELYHKILTFGIDNGNDILETHSGRTTKTKFKYEDYHFDLTYETVGQTTAYSASDVNIAFAKDRSYSIYKFTINTGRQPQSQWLDKEAAKQAKRDATGKKKKSAADLM